MPDNATKFGSPWFENEGVLKLRPQAWRGAAGNATKFGADGIRDKASGDIKFNSMPWRGVDPGYASQFGSQSFNENDGTHRTRPQPWRSRRSTSGTSDSEDEDDSAGDTPTPPVCTYSFFIRLDTDAQESQTVYLQEGASAVCYYGNTPVGNLAFTGTNPPSCVGFGSGQVAGTYNPMPSSPMTFTGWWNQLFTCTGCQADSTNLYISNTGTCDLVVNIGGVDTTIAAGANHTFTPSGVANAGCNNGDQSAYGAGTVITITQA